jgi:hypothetical protein
VRIITRVSVVVGVLTLGVVAHVSGQAAPSKAWTVPRTADGRPDIQGVWANNNMTPLERPKQFAGRATMTDAELTDLKSKVKQLLDGGDAFFFDELILAALPPTVPGYAERARAARVAASAGRGPADRAQDMGLSTRCVHFGTPNLMAGYQSYFAFTQSPDAVVMRTEMIHDARVIPLDNRPHLSNAITMYHGDARGRWDGDTLVVDTRNFSPNTSFRGSSEGFHLIEKFKRVADDTLEYYVTIEDPTVWTRPWTLMIPLKRTGEEMFEYACHEGNYGLPAILRGARVQEAEAAAKRP